MDLANCSVCGRTAFESVAVLWKDLIEKWELSDEEVEYINRQQGFYCLACGNNLRAMALADAILNAYSIETDLVSAVASGCLDGVSVLEINHAGGLTKFLSPLPQHQLVTYPEYDLLDLEIPSDKFDLVIHSDTLEHISDPVKALTECRRVLKENSKCIFTIPIITRRMSRSRAGLPASYHGNQNSGEQDLLVQTEFGSDFWEYVLQAGFRSCTVSCIEYPGGLAIQAIS